MESVTPVRALCCGELCAMENFTQHDMEGSTQGKAWHHSEAGTMESLAPWSVPHHGECCRSPSHPGTSSHSPDPPFPPLATGCAFKRRGGSAMAEGARIRPVTCSAAAAWQ